MRQGRASAAGYPIASHMIASQRRDPPTFGSQLEMQWFKFLLNTHPKLSDSYRYPKTSVFKNIWGKLLKLVHKYHLNTVLSLYCFKHEWSWLFIPVLDQPVLPAIWFFTIANYQDSMIQISAATVWLIVRTWKVKSKPNERLPWPYSVCCHHQ
jgi:hypothetical protein